MAETPIAAVKDAVHEIQLALLDGIQEEERLILAGSLMSRGDYEDVVTERAIVNLCGYPLCSNKLPTERRSKGRYRVSLKEHKVFDQQETDSYCSSICMVNSRSFSVSLQEKRSSDLNPAKIENVMKKFAGLSLDAKSEGMVEKGYPDVSKLKIQEKNGGNMSLVNSVGPSNAIEGYVPRQDRSSQHSHPRKQKKVSKAKQNAKQTSFLNDMDFTSFIITEDEYSVSKMPSSGMDPSSSSSKSGISMGTPISDNEDHQFSIFEATHHSSKNSMKTNARGSAFQMNRSPTKDKQVTAETSGSLITCPTGTTDDACVDGISKLCESMCKSSLKSPGLQKQRHSVSWADEQVGDHGKINLCEFEELKNVDSGKKWMKDKAVVDENNDDNNMIRFASAEACATALSQAAEIVASGEADVNDAVSVAGIIILPTHPDEDKGEADNGIVDLDTIAIKWPKKREISESDVLDSTDSWLDPPPDGFSLTLSPFATMFMSIFAWITSSSVAYIYGQDESSHEEYSSINGKEYPRKIIMSGGCSSEIKLTLAGYLARALPGLVAELRLPVPVSIMEKELGRLLETMTFIDPLPSLRMKQWQLITLLFLDALSVCRIHALQPIMTSQRMLLHKVFESAQVGIEEYEVMKEHIIPLGRTPTFSAQSGA